MHDCRTEHIKLTEETYGLQENCKLKLTVLARENKCREGYLFYPLQIKFIEPQKNCKNIRHHNNEKSTEKSETNSKTGIPTPQWKFFTQ